MLPTRALGAPPRPAKRRPAHSGRRQLRVGADHWFLHADLCAFSLLFFADTTPARKAPPKLTCSYATRIPACMPRRHVLKPSSVRDTQSPKPSESIDMGCPRCSLRLIRASFPFLSSLSPPCRVLPWRPSVRACVRAWVGGWAGGQASVLCLVYATSRELRCQCKGGLKPTNMVSCL